MIDVFFQGYETALLFVLGIPSGLLLDLVTRLRQNCGAVVGTALDVLYLLTGSALFLLGVLLASNGTMRLFYAIAFSAGTAVSAWAFYPLFFRKLAKKP